MRKPSYTARFLMLLPVLVSLLFLTACRTSTVQPPQPTQAQATATTKAPALPTATQASTPTAPPVATATTAPTQAPTETLAPTSTSVPPTPTSVPTLGFAEPALSGWCVEPDTLLLSTADPASPPANARIGKQNGSAFEINNLPSNGCVFMYTFNQPVPQGLKLAIFDLNQKKPWLETDLSAVNGKPDSAAAILRHSYIIAPPLWKVSFTFAVSDASGNTLRSDRVNLNRWIPRTCWNGQPPNVFTLRCPLAEDLHPWDPSYRTPIPTYIPPNYWQVNP